GISIPNAANATQNAAALTVQMAIDQPTARTASAGSASALMPLASLATTPSSALLNRESGRTRSSGAVASVGQRATTTAAASATSASRPIDVAASAMPASVGSSTTSSAIPSRPIA